MGGGGWGVGGGGWGVGGGGWGWGVGGGVWEVGVGGARRGHLQGMGSPTSVTIDPNFLEMLNAITLGQRETDFNHQLILVRK